MMMFIDTHAHIYLDQFKGDFEELIRRTREADVQQVLMPNIDVASMSQVMKTAVEYPDMCQPMAGLHPCSVDREWRQQLDQIEPYTTDERIIAIGEIGIDLYWDQTFQSEQEEAFRYQIAWALERDLPIVIHSRAAIDHTIRIVDNMQNGQLRGVFHCFDQSTDHARQITDVGFYLGLGGIITYKKNTGLREAVASIPLSSILLETDAPYLPPVPYRGKRNESSYIPIIARKIAEIHGVDIVDVAQITTTNAKNLFRI